MPNFGRCPGPESDLVGVGGIGVGGTEVAVAVAVG